MLNTAITLDLLPDGAEAAIAGLTGAGVHVDRLHALGFDEGVRVAVLHRAPMGGDPIAVRVGAATVALSRSLARHVRLG